MSNPRPTLYYDGHCALCSGWVKTVLRLDDEAIFQFAPLQSAFAKTRLTALGLDPEVMDSVVLEADGRAFLKSDVAFEVMRMLGWPYRALNVFSVLPKGLRDKVYDLIAANRYRIFGQHDACWMPQAAWKDRFVGER